MYQIFMPELTQWRYDIACETQLDTFCLGAINYKLSSQYHWGISQVAVDVLQNMCFVWGKDRKELKKGIRKRQRK